MSRIIIGIDPGTGGGFALYDAEKDTMLAFKMPPTFPDIYNFLADIKASTNGDIVAYMENVGHGMPGQSSKATAVFARHNGHIEMALYALGIRTEMVTPQKWMKFYSNTIGSSKGYTKTEWKNKLKGEAQRRYPETKPTLCTADAILIAEYGRKQN